MDKVNAQNCYCCNSKLIKQDLVISLTEIFKMWEDNGVLISKETKSDYSPQSSVQLYKCPECKFGIFLPMLTGSANFYSDITKNDYYLDTRWDFIETEKFLANVPPTHSILDVGCGQGAFLKSFKKKFPTTECHGLDSNTEVKKISNDIQLHRDTSTLPSEFDVLTSFQVIEHVETPHLLLNNLKDKIKSGGYIIVSVPDYSGPISFFEKTHTALPPHHVTQWNPEALKRLLERLGFSDIQILYEPLPHYLYNSYLPEIISHFFNLQNNLKWKSRVHRACNFLIKILIKLNIKTLPFHGHTCMAIGKKK